MKKLLITLMTLILISGCASLKRSVNTQCLDLLRTNSPGALILKYTWIGDKNGVPVSVGIQYFDPSINFDELFEEYYWSGRRDLWIGIRHSCKFEETSDYTKYGMPAEAANTALTDDEWLEMIRPYFYNQELARYNKYKAKYPNLPRSR